MYELRELYFLQEISSVKFYSKILQKVFYLENF